MGDLFGDWVNQHQLVQLYDPTIGYGMERQLWWWVMEIIRLCPQHTFLFLTKNPKGLKAWSPFPDNCVVGVSVCNQKMYDEALKYLTDIEAKHKWLSFEPLLEGIAIKPIDLAGISWVVIGAQSNPTIKPQTEWLLNITNACDKMGTKMWLKNNLGLGIPRQEKPI